MKIGGLPIIFIMLLVGCSPTNSTTIHPTPTFSRFLPPTWTPTITITPTETQISTPLPTSTPPNTVMPSFSYIAPIEPTLIDSVAKQTLTKMLSQNGGCQLPCWWGIQLGRTRWNEARTTLYSFAGKIEELQYTEISNNNETHQHIIAVVYYQRNESSEYFEIQSTDGIVESVSANPDTTLKYNLSNILTDYGSPTDVYINTTYASPTGKVPFNLVVYYEEKGVLAFYTTEHAPIINEKIYFCSKNDAPVWLYLWNPSPARNEKEKKAFLSGLDYWMYDTGFHSVQDTSNSTLEQFYVNFKDTNSGSCLVTSTDTWADLSTHSSPIMVFPTSTPSPIYPWEEKTLTPTSIP